MPKLAGKLIDGGKTRSFKHKSLCFGSDGTSEFVLFVRFAVKQDPDDRTMILYNFQGGEERWRSLDNWIAKRGDSWIRTTYARE